MKKDQLHETDSSTLESIQSACLKADKEAQALLLAFAQGYVAAKKKYHKENKDSEKKDEPDNE